MKRLYVLIMGVLMALLPFQVMADPGAKQAMKASQSALIGAKLSAGLVGVAVLAGVVGHSGSGNGGNISNLSHGGNGNGGNGNGNGNGGGGGGGGGSASGTTP